MTSDENAKTAKRSGGIVSISWNGTNYQIGAVLTSERECRHVIKLAELIAEQIAEDKTEAKAALPAEPNRLEDQ